MWCMMLIDLHMLNHPCEPGMNPTWSWCMIFFILCRILFDKNLDSLGLINHNPVKNSLWILKSDVEKISNINQDFY